MGALKMFGQFPETKQEIQSFVDAAKEEILTNGDALEIDLKLKKMEELIKGIREDSEVKIAVFTELERYPEKTVKLSNCEITKKLLTSWNYDLCGDSELSQMEAKARILAEQIKDRKAILQKIEDGSMVNASTGEFIYRAEKSVKDSISIKIL